MPPITGDLGSSGIPRLFRAIADEKRTGLLTIESPGDRGDREALIYFREGDVYHTGLKGSGIRLGTRLISAGMVSHEEIETALTIQRGEGRKRRLGEILVDAGYLDTDQLAAIVREQMQDIAFEVLKWDSGTFSYEEGAAAQEDTELEVSVENLIMEGARRFREWHTITRRIPTLEAVPRFGDDGEAVEVVLTPDEWSLVSRVDGSTTIKELANQCGFTDLEAARCVFGMVSAGLLTVDLPPGVELPSDEPGIEEMFDELERALDEAARAPRDPSASVSLRELAGSEEDIEEAEERVEEPDAMAEAATGEAPPSLEAEDVEGEPEVQPEPLEETAVDEEPEPVGALEEEEPEPVGALEEEEPEPVGALEEEEPEPVGSLEEEEPEPVGVLDKEEPEPVGVLEEEGPDLAEEEAEPVLSESPESLETESDLVEAAESEPLEEEPLSDQAVAMESSPADTFHPLDEALSTNDAAPAEAAEEAFAPPDREPLSDIELPEEVPTLPDDDRMVEEAAAPQDGGGEIADLPDLEELPEITGSDRSPSPPGPTRVHEEVIEAVGSDLREEGTYDEVLDPTSELEAAEKISIEGYEVFDEPEESPDLERETAPPEETPIEAEHAEVLAEETEEEPVQVTSVARMFADLANPVEETTVTLAPGGDNGHEEPDDPEPEEAEEHQGKKWSEEPRRVDPSVDVKSLIREFSSLDDE